MWYLITGILFGIVSGMGLGGGVVLIPVLTALLGEAQHTAQALSLLAFLPMSACALLAHKKQGNLCIPPALWLAAGGLAGAVAGALLAGVLESALLRRLYGGFLLLLAAGRAWSGLRKKGCEKGQKRVP